MYKQESTIAIKPERPLVPQKELSNFNEEVNKILDPYRQILVSTSIAVIRLATILVPISIQAKIFSQLVNLGYKDNSYATKMSWYQMNQFINNSFEDEEVKGLFLDLQADVGEENIQRLRTHLKLLRDTSIPMIEHLKGT